MADVLFESDVKDASLVVVVEARGDVAAVEEDSR